MQITVEKLSPILVEVQIQVPAEHVQSEVDKAYSTLQRTAHVKGFRPGKVPRPVLAHLFGGRVSGDVAQKLMQDTLQDALQRQKLQPLTQPQIAPSELRPEEAFSYKARFEVRPDITEVKWEGLEATRPSTTVSDAAVDAELQRLRHEHATLQAPADERPARVGDIVSLTFRIEVDGKPQGPVEQELEVELGAGKVMRELEDAVTGTRPGDEKELSVVFSPQHQSPDLRGKAGVFFVKVTDVRERIFPEIDDELAKDCGEDDLEKLRAAQRVKIEKELTQRAEENVGQQLILALCRANPMQVPPSLVEQQAQATERELAAMARRQNQRLELTPEIKAGVRADAEVKVLAGLLVSQIAAEKQIQVTEADLEQGYVELAAESGKNVAKVKAEHRDPQKRQTLAARILEDRIMTLIEGAAKITQV